MTSNTKPGEPKKIVNSFCWIKTNLDFELVYKNGKTIISNDKKIKVRYLINTESEKHRLKLGLSIISKKGKSVWRNRVKRILREILIQQKDILLDIADQKKSLLIIFSPYSINQNNSGKIFLRDIKSPVLELLYKLKKITSETKN